MAPLWCVRLCCAVVMALVPAVALAQGSAGNKAAAEALFEEGRTLMQKQQYEAACSKLEASQELDAGLGTLMLLSDCYEKTGRTASAWATFREAAAMARGKGDDERERVARARAEALEPNLAKLVIHGADSTMKLSGLEVKMAGQSVPRAQWGTPIPVDPGAVSFEVSAPGYKPWTLEAQVVPGPSETAIDIPELQPLEAEPGTAGTQEVAVSGGDGTFGGDEAPASGSESAGGALKTTGLVLGIAGVVAVGVGTYFGLDAKSKNDDSKDACPGNQCTTRAGLDARNDAKSAATTSTVAFVLGGALLATGGVLYFMDDSSEGASASTRRELRWSSRVGLGSAQIGLEGTW